MGNIKLGQEKKEYLLTKVCEQVVWLNTSVSEEKLFAFLTSSSFAYGVLN